MKVLTGAAAAMALLVASPALAQTTTGACAVQAAPAPAAIDGATVTNEAMQAAHGAMAAWAATRQAQVQACRAEIEAMRAQLNGLETGYNASVAELNAAVAAFATETEEFNARGGNQGSERRPRGSVGASRTN